MAIPNKYGGFHLSNGDATGKQLTLLLKTDYEVLHVASAADADTDWNVAAPTNPTVYVHSETTPATDYISLSHDGTAGTITVAGGTLALNGVTSLGLQVGGTEEVTLTATVFSPTTNAGNALGSTTLGWNGLHLGTATAINWANGEVTLTEAANSLTIDGGDVHVANGFGVIIGHTAQVVVGGVTSELQVLGTAPADSTMALSAWSADAVPPRLYFAKSRSATVGTFSIITSGDNLGEILAFGDDGVDFNSNANASAAIIFDSAGTIAADRIAGVIRLMTATDAAPSVLTTAVTIDQAQLVTLAAGLTVTAGAVTISGTTETTGAGVGIVIIAGGLAADKKLATGKAGGTTGAVLLTGTTSGVVTLSVADAAGTWTMKLPAAVGGAGEQLTDAGGNGVTSWAAAASMREYKTDIEVIDHEAEAALKRMVGRHVYRFRYDKEIGKGTQDFDTQYEGVMADEYPEAMHFGGRVLNPISTFGESMLAIKALADKVERLERAAASPA